MIKFSIISTVYNQQEYIKDCIESVLAQTYTNFEHIIVDDGSIDNSYNVCMEYAKRDSRIKVIHKENGGVSSARNVGLDNVTGDYVFFLDGDDFFHPELLQTCLNNISNNEDILEFGLCNCNEFGKMMGHMNFPDETYFINNDATLNYFKMNFFCYGGMPSRRCFKIDIIKKNALIFNVKIRYAEDILFSLKAVMHSNKIKSISFIGYNYRDNYSCTSKVTCEEKSNAISIVLIDFYNFLKENKFTNSDFVFNYIFNELSLNFVFGHRNLSWSVDKNIIRALSNNNIKSTIHKLPICIKEKNNKKIEFYYIEKRDILLKKYFYNQSKIKLYLGLINLKILMFFIKVKRKTKLIFKRK